MSAANFARCLSLVLVHEGGWSDHPADPGGATMRGVTLATFRRHYGQDRTKDDLRAITDDQLAHIYRSGYWDACGCDDLPDGLDYAVFDSAVNSGPGKAKAWLAASADAKFCRMNRVDVMCYQRLQFLRALPTWKAFGHGWARRVNEVNEMARSMVFHADAPQAPQGAPQTLIIGDTGDAVKKLQHALGIAPEDGRFGEATRDAVTNFQRERGLHVDGVVGRQTWRALGMMS